MAIVVIDAGWLIALERRKPRAVALVAELLRSPRRLVIPAGVLAQVWRDGGRQTVLAALIRRSHVDVLPLDAAMARACGEALRGSRIRDVVV